jgi:crotonobetaine/carnitine-CoA ligase
MKTYPIRERVLGRIVADKAREHGVRPFLSFEGRTLTYRDLNVISNKLANGLAARGVSKGTHVALMIENKPEIVLLFVALGKLGAVSVPLNTASKGELLAYYLEQSDSEVLVADAALVPSLAAIGGRVPKLRNVFSIAEAGQEQPAAGSIGWPLSNYAELLDGSESAPDVDVRFNDLHSLLYTSGTTGPSKGNLSTHSHTVSCGLVLAEIYGYRADDVLYVCLPVFHGNAWLCSVMPALIADASFVMVRRFSASGFWDDIRRFDVTQFNSLGAMTSFLWSQPPSPADRDHKVRQVMVVPTPKQIYHQFEERFGIKFTSVYALTDCGMVTVRGPADPPSKWESCGKPAPYCEVRIVDDDDFELLRGTPGEIVVRTNEPWIFAQGYYNMPASTTSIFRNLWFHTGDRGLMDEDGYIFFVDRKKDAIRRRGENISSFEVEQMILMHPAVLDVAAFPVHSEHSEDEVMVSVVLRDGARLTEDELVHHCNDNMAYFMVPRYVEFMSYLPKTMTEKVEKYKLKQDAKARLGEIWDREKAGIVVKR